MSRKILSIEKKRVSATTGPYSLSNINKQISHFTVAEKCSFLSLSVFYWYYYCCCTKEPEWYCSILEGFSKVLPDSHFRNGGIKRNWSNIFMIVLLIVGLWTINSLKLWMNYFWSNFYNLSVIPSILKQEYGSLGNFLR